jgi:hypothetical protein
MAKINEVLSQRSQGQHEDPTFDAINPQQSQHRKSSVAPTLLDNSYGDQVVLAPRYPVDGITESHPCEMHVKGVNISMKAAVGYVSATTTYHYYPVPNGYVVAGVDEVMAGYEPVMLDQPAGEDGGLTKLGEAIRTIVLC